MNIYFLFSNIKNEYICRYIYTKENNKVFSYSYDEGYIVKSEESTYKSLDEIEDTFKSKTSAAKNSKQSNPPKLLQKEFFDVRQSLYYLNGTLENFNEEIPARKRLPEIISPYDMDFEETDSFDDFGERGFEETTGDFKSTKPDHDDDSFDDDDSASDVFDEDNFDDQAYSDNAFDESDLYDDDFDGDDRFDDDDDDDYYKK